VKKFLALAVLLLLGISFCAPDSPSLSSPTITSTFGNSTGQDIISNPSPTATTSLQLQLNSLLIKGRAPKTGYSRDQFGAAWVDVDRNGCDTRNDILNRDLTYVIHNPGTNNCVVASGNFYDPYTATQFEFVKSSNGSTVEIDHIVSLSDAWQKGAQQWDSQTRKDFANDPLNLTATSRSANRSKSDSDAASWLPSNRAIRCAFIARQIAVKSAYQLWVTQAEFDAMTRVLSTCPYQPIANSGML
jgi:hypothetical protein